MNRYFLHLSYKGTNYFGWQIQPNQPSIQETIERALTKMNSNQPIDITGCGRTDTGVHATDYYAHFDLPANVDCQQMKYKLNLMLPSDIAIKAIIPVQPDAHARFDAISRTYKYHIHTEKNPFLSDTSWLLNYPLNHSKIAEACEIIKGHSDFECFSKVNTDVNNFNCEIQALMWDSTQEGYCLTISANRFLRNMVRAVVGTLIEVGLEKISPEQVDAIILSKNRSNAGKSAPAEGLTLTKVVYPYLT